MRALALLCVLCALGGGIAAIVVGGAGAAESGPAPPDGARLVAQIDHFRAVTWRWQRLIGTPITHTARSARLSPDLAYRRWVLSLWRHRAKRAERRARPWLAAQVRGFQATVRHWQRVMGIAAGPTRQTAGVKSELATYRIWKSRAAAIVRRAQHPPYAAALGCIHRYEGSWTDPGAPYYGGLQMDIAFQAHYGGYLLRTKGTADHWTPLEQMWVAARAARSGRGFYPWPNSARVCGLI